MANYPMYPAPYTNNYTPLYQAMPSPQPQPAGFTVRGVTSKEEALAAQADYMSAGHVMPDLAHGVVYVKRPNLVTGACDLLTFRLVTPEEDKPVQYVTLDEFNNFKNEIRRNYESYAANRPAPQRRESGSGNAAAGYDVPAGPAGYVYDAGQEPRRAPADGSEHLQRAGYNS